MRKGQPPPELFEEPSLPATSYGSVFKVNFTVNLDQKDASFVLNLDSQLAIDTLLLQGTVPLDILQIN